MPDRSYLYRAHDGYRWRRQAANGLMVAASSESYEHRKDATENYVRVSGEDAPLLEDLTDETPSDPAED